MSAVVLGHTIAVKYNTTLTPVPVNCYVPGPYAVHTDEIQNASAWTGDACQLQLYAKTLALSIT